MKDTILAKIESDIKGFVRASYPEMVIRAEYLACESSRIALFFIDERFRGLYPRQRYHYLVHLIPKEYYDSTLADTEWFELTPDEVPGRVEDNPDEEFIASISPDVIGVLQRKGFFATLDEMFAPTRGTNQPQRCAGDFRHAKQALELCGFEESDWSDIFHVLMAEGAFCDCEILYNTGVDSRLKSHHCKRLSHETKS